MEAVAPKRGENQREREVDDVAAERPLREHDQAARQRLFRNVMVEVGGSFVDVIIPEGHDPASEHPFKGDVDLGKLAAEHVASPDFARRERGLERGPSDLDDEQRGQRQVGHQGVEAVRGVLVQKPEAAAAHAEREQQEHRQEAADYRHGGGVYQSPTAPGPRRSP